MVAIQRHTPTNVRVKLPSYPFGTMNLGCFCINPRQETPKKSSYQYPDGSFDQVIFNHGKKGQKGKKVILHGVGIPEKQPARKPRPENKVAPTRRQHPCLHFLSLKVFFYCFLHPSLSIRIGVCIGMHIQYIPTKVTNKFMFIQRKTSTIGR